MGHRLWALVWLYEALFLAAWSLDRLPEGDFLAGDLTRIAVVAGHALAYWLLWSTIAVRQMMAFGVRRGLPAGIGAVAYTMGSVGYLFALLADPTNTYALRPGLLVLAVGSVLMLLGTAFIRAETPSPLRMASAPGLAFAEFWVQGRRATAVLTAFLASVALICGFSLYGADRLDGALRPVAAVAFYLAIHGYVALVLEARMGGTSRQGRCGRFHRENQTSRPESINPFPRRHRPSPDGAANLFPRLDVRGAMRRAEVAGDGSLTFRYAGNTKIVGLPAEFWISLDVTPQPAQGVDLVNQDNDVHAGVYCATWDRGEYELLRTGEESIRCNDKLTVRTLG